MKTIAKIAKTELSVLFYSPVAWLVLIVFAFQSGFQFSSILEMLETQQEIGRELASVTFKVFADISWDGLFLQVKDTLYFYIPLLTMGLMSREISSGSIKLLFSSPVRNAEIILGKFLAMLVYGLVMILSLLLIVWACCHSVQALDIKFIFSGLVGLYLLLAAYAAIGLFMSCLTSYQVVAALGTLAVFALLNYVGSLWQDIDFVRDLTYFLSISGRADQMITGLISTKDVLYFLLVIAMFLGFCVFQLKASRESSSFFVKIGRYVLLSCIVLMTGYITSRPALVGYYDMTATKWRTLTPASQDVLKKIKGPVQITTYVNLLDRFSYYGLPEMRNRDLEQFEEYTRFLPDITFKYVYYYDSTRDEYLYKNNPGKSLSALARKLAVGQRLDLDMFLTPQQIKKQFDASSEENRFVRILESGHQKASLRMFKDLMVYPSESEKTAAFKRLVVAPPRIGFLTDEHERSIDKSGDHDYGKTVKELTYRYALINQGFDFTNISLKDKDIPAGISCIVIADPRVNLSDSAMLRLERYIHRGGNIFIVGEPGKREVLNPLLAPLGLTFTAGTLVEPSKDYAPDYLLATFAKGAGALERYFEVAKGKDAIISLPGTQGIDYSKSTGFTITPLVVTDSSKSWNRIAVLSTDSFHLEYQPDSGDQKKSFTPILGLSRPVNGREQRIVVAGDADFISNVELNRHDPETSNFALFTGIMKWLSNDQFPIDTYRIPTKDTRILIGQRGISFIKIIFRVIIPGFVLLFGAILLIRRKRK